MVAISDKLGQGIYTPQEAARFARLTTATFKRWFWGDRVSRRVVAPDFNPTEKLASFANLIEAVAISNLRRQKIGRGVSLEKIREAVHFAENHLGIENVLARRHALYVFDGKVWIEKDGEILGLNKGDRAQYLDKRVAEVFLEELTFRDDGLATRWVPLERSTYKLAIDASRRFGQPIVEPYGVLAGVLAQSVLSEGTIDAAAEAHEVHRDAVVLAMKYYNEYLLASPA